MSDFARLENLFFGALGKTEPEERQRFLDTECGQDVALREQVERLIAGQVAAGSFLEKPAAPEATQAFAISSENDSTKEPELLGTHIGPYKLLQKLGEGGMGVVYMAEQTQPVHRKVALKIIKPGMNSLQIIARFEAERQALAMMDHVNIARVIDGGTIQGVRNEGSGFGSQETGKRGHDRPDASLTPDPSTLTPGLGRPYFVMELIQGIPITKNCDDNHLTPRERLELFVPVCQAVQHAHQKGIIHRDIKPSNVLVTLYDGKPVPKVIDFGVAKAIDQKLTDNTLFTNFGTMVGTLEYMSPEQAEMSNLGVDTRSDIYSLGVLLYELLTGSTPLTRKRIKEAANLEILRLIKEEEPQKPSTRLSESGDALASISANRHTEPAKLTKLVRGELDWIVMKTLEKDRNRRYETANGLAVELQRYLADEPVLACPPSTGYRVRKFVQRNKGAVIATSIVFVSLVGGIFGTTWGLFEASRQRDGAQRRLTQIERGNDILGSIFKNLDPETEGKDDQSLRVQLGARLANAAKQLEGEAIGDSIVVAKLQKTLGESLMALGYPEQALELYTKAHKTLTSLLDKDHPDIIDCKSNLALSYAFNGKFEQAIPLMEATLSLAKSKLGVDHRDTIKTANNLACGYLQTGKLERAIQLLDETLELSKKKLGPDDIDTLMCMDNLSTCYMTKKNPEQALPLVKTVYERHHVKLGADHTNTLTSMNNLASCYSELHKLDLAIPLFQESLKLVEKKLGPIHPNTLKAMGNLAMVYQKDGKLDLAIPLFEDALRLEKAKLGIDHADSLASMSNLALAYRAAGKFDRSLSLSLQAAEGIEKLKYQSIYAQDIVESLCSCYEHLNQFDHAEIWRRKWLAAEKARSEANSLPVINAQAKLSRNLMKQKKFTEAESLLGESLSILKKQSPEHWQTFNLTSLLGGALLGQRKYSEAGPLIEGGYQGLKRCDELNIPNNNRPNAVYYAEAQERLVEFFEATNQKEKARTWREKIREAKPPEK